MQSSDIQQEGMVVDLPSLSRNFPLEPVPQVPRESLVSTLRNLVLDNIYAVSVEGVEGIGKTTLLSQLVRKYKSISVSVFMSAVNKLSYDPELIRSDLAGQVYWLLTGDMLPREQDDPALLKSLYADLQRLAKQKKLQILFVFDGLEELDATSQSLLLQQLPDLLPLGIPQFRFFFSGDQSLYSKVINSKLQTKPFIVTEFGVEETKALFARHSLSVEEANDLNILCRGIPGRLAAALRAIDRGIPPTTFLQDAPSKWPELFDIDWRQVGPNDESLRKVLAVLAHDARPYSITDIAETIGSTNEEVTVAISRVNFLISDETGRELRFASRGLRAYAAEQLKDKKHYVMKCLIKRLLKTEEGQIAVPEYLEETADYQDILSLLTPEHILQVLERSQTLSKVGETVKRGFRSAQKLGRDADILRFGIQGSVIGEMASSDVWEYEVAALAALRRDDEAINLANNAMLREDRLQMLATFAQHVWLRGDVVRPELIDQIKLLIDNVDAWSLGRRSATIASKLTCVNPDLATTVLKKGSNPVSAADVERTFAALTVSALNDVKDERRRNEFLQTAASSREDPKARSLIEGVRVLSVRLSPAEVCEQAKDINAPEARLSVLRYWCLLNGGVQGADTVADQAIKLALATSSSTIDASLLADISSVLVRSEEAQAKALIGTLDGLRGSAQRLGPSVDYVRLQLTVAKAESLFDPIKAEGRLLETFDYILQIDDLAAKGESLARFLATVKTMHRRESITLTEAKCADTLEEVVLTLSESTADQYLALGGIITGLAVGDLAKALDYTNVVNTEQRRDDILKDIVERLMHQPASAIEIEKLSTALHAIKRADVREHAILTITQRFSDESVSEPQLRSLIPLFTKLPGLRDSILSCRGLVHAVKILGRSAVNHSALEEHLMSSLFQRWKGIDVGWSRINAGFGIATDLASTRASDALNLLDETQALKTDFRIAAPRQAMIFIACIRLALRIFCGLLPKHLETAADLEAIVALVEILPSYGERAALWADLCMRTILSGRIDYAERISKEKLLPQLSYIPGEDAAYRARVIAQCAPALFKTVPASCLEELDALNSDDRDEALLDIVEFLILKRVPSDPSNVDEASYAEVTYETLLQAETLVNRLETDWMVYAATKWVADTLLSPANKYSITLPQREDIGNRFANLAKAKLPTIRHISHPGFRIATLTQAYRISQRRQPEWLDLISQAETLSNVADRVFVFQIIAMALPRALSREKESLLTKAYDQIGSIPWRFDQVERYLGLADDLRVVDAGLCRNAITRASGVISGGSDDVIKQRRQLVDLAFRVDEEFAKKLIETFDDDVAKRRARDEVRLLEVRKSIMESAGRPDEEKVANIRSADVSRLGTMLVKSLNAGRIQHYHPSDIRQYLELVADQPIRRAYHMLMWYLDNAIYRFSRTDHAASFIRPMFDGCVVGAQLAGQISGKALIRLKAFKVHGTNLAADRSLFLVPPSRDEAIKAVAAWAEKNLGEEVLITDPYFGPGDLHWLQILRMAREDCKVTVMTARLHQPSNAAGEDLEELYASTWYKCFDQSPPSVEIAIIGGEKTKESPVHDRWLISGGTGLRFGTSLNSLGLTKDSEISQLSESSAEQARLLVESYLQREKTEHKNEKLRLTRFFL